MSIKRTKKGQIPSPDSEPQDFHFPFISRLVSSWSHPLSYLQARYHYGLIHATTTPSMTSPASLP